MYHALRGFTVNLVATAMVHALELPGTRRLGEDRYHTVQPIYYPGFTVGGLVGEPGGLPATLLLVLSIPAATPTFWLTSTAFIVLLAMHLLYRMLTLPLEQLLAQGTDLKTRAGGFYVADPFNKTARLRAANSDWTMLRDRWEHSHLARAALAMLRLILLVTAVAV